MQTQRSRVKWRKGAKDKSAKYTNRTLHKFHRSRCASTGVVRTRCRNQEDWCELNALQFGFAYVDRAAGSYNTTTSYGIRRLPKPLSIHCRLNRVSIHWEVDYSKFMSTRIFNIGFDATAVAQCMSKQICIITCWAACRLATRRNCKLLLVMTQPDRYF